MQTSVTQSLQIKPILDAVMDGRALSPDEALFLLSLDKPGDLAALQQAAGELARRQVSQPTQPTFSCSLFLTNLCELQPQIYPYPKQPGQPGVFVLGIDEIDAVLETCQRQEQPHLSISGGGFWSTLRPPGFEKPTLMKTYARLLEYIREKCPFLYLSGFSPDEVEFLSIVTGYSPRYILEFLKDHGIQELRGGPLGLLVTSVRRQISPKLMPVKEWLELVRLAANLQMPTRLEVDLGHLEKMSERVQHLVRVREFLAADKHAEGLSVFTGVAPYMLIRNPSKQQHWEGARHAAPKERSKWLAVSRLFLGEHLPVQGVFWCDDATDPLEEAAEGLRWGASQIGETDALSRQAFLMGAQPASWLLPQLNREEMVARQKVFFDITPDNH